MGNQGVVTMEMLAGSINNLAAMVARGFESMATKAELNQLKFEVALINERLDKLETRIARVEARVDQLYDLMTSLEETLILDLQTRLQVVEKRVDIKH